MRWTVVGGAAHRVSQLHFDAYASKRSCIVGCKLELLQPCGDGMGSVTIRVGHHLRG